MQKCSSKGTAYVADPNSGSDVDVLDVTSGYGWEATVQNPDGTTRSAKLASFVAGPPIAGRDGPQSTLTLAIELDMGQPVPLNQLAVMVRQEGGLWPTITGVDVSLDHNQWQPMRCQGNALTWQGAAAAAALTTTQIDSGGSSAPATGDNVLGGSLWEIPSYAAVDNAVTSPLFRYIAVTFAQPDSYACPKGIGHPYYVKVTQTSKSSHALFGLISSHSQSTQTQRLPTPSQLVGVAAGQSTSSQSTYGKTIGSVLGVAATAALGTTFGGPLTKALGGIGKVVSGVVSGLIGGSSKSTEILQTE